MPSSIHFLKIKSQSLFYWIIYSYKEENMKVVNKINGLNPYFTGLSILIGLEIEQEFDAKEVSILILLDYLFLFAPMPLMRYFH